MIELILILSISVNLFLLYQNNKLNSKSNIYQNFEIINELFNKSKEQAYIKIFCEYLITELTCHTKLNTQQINNLSKEYIKLLFLFSGEHIINDLSRIYGSKTNLISFLTSEFVNRIISDERDHYEKQSSYLSGELIDETKKEL